jgi:urease subunit gamma/beta
MAAGGSGSAPLVRRPRGRSRSITGMYLTPTEEDRLTIFTAAELARRSLADGARLNAPEATALICDEMHRAARRGVSLDGVLAAGRRAVGAVDLMDGIPALVPEIRLEVLMDDGMRLVVLREPWGQP